MSQKFKISKTKEMLYKQWHFLEKRNFYFFDKFLRKGALLILSGAIAYFMLLFLSPINDYIIVKGMLTVLLILACITLVVIFFIFLVKKYRYKKNVNSYLEPVTPEQLNYEVEMDDEEIKIVTTNTSFEFFWSSYSAYGIGNNTIYVFNTSKPLETLYWSIEEMGNENYQFLKDILDRKLIKRAF
jgi:Ca2+/Na+ antiporter